MSETLDDDLDELTLFERAFIRAALAYRGLHGTLTIDQFELAFLVMEKYSQQRLDNPPSAGSEAWLPS